MITDTVIDMEISDNGKGFNVKAFQTKEIGETQGYGLYNMKERVEIVGGVLEITSEPRRGTTIKINIPNN
jgi:signal transduction histidine kinase